MAEAAKGVRGGTKNAHWRVTPPPTTLPSSSSTSHPTEGSYLVQQSKYKLKFF